MNAIVYLYLSQKRLKKSKMCYQTQINGDLDRMANLDSLNVLLLS